VQRMLGIDSDPTGRFHVELIRHPDVTRIIAAAVAGDAGRGNEVRLNTDPPKVLLANARPFAANGERGVALVLHDVTEYRRADQVRQDFVANVSHELRTPLTAIRGGVEALVDEDRPEERRFVAIIARNSARMERLVSDLLQPNLSYDVEATQATQREAVANVDPVFVILKKGKVVVRQGDEIGSGQLRQIEAIGNLPRESSSPAQVVSLALLIGSLLAVFGYLLRNLWPTQWNFMRLAVLAGTVLVTQTIVLKVFGFVGEALSESLSLSFAGFPDNDEAYFFFALPFALGAMLVTILVDDRAGLIFSLLSSILAVLTLGSDIYGFFYVLMSNLIGILTIRSAVQRVGFVGAGFKLGSAAIGLFVVLQYAKLAPFDLGTGFLGATLALLSGPINTGLLVFLLPLFERFFMVTTIMRLQELGNVNLPLIRELILKAPGTYNHSVAVGTLSEGAAEAIGLNPVFARVACFYHDIGKTIHPEYYVENQRGENIHDRISPEESARLVLRHVTMGIRMARAAKLPSSMIDIIPQHHGTKLLTYFHEKAKANAAGRDEVQEARFRYPGPKPQTKMAAIIMLADAVEAAARTLNDHSQEKLLELIQKIVASTTEDGQLSECDITLAEIDRIAFSFLETLSSVYHARITYPGFEFERTQESAP